MRFDKKLTLILIFLFLVFSCKTNDLPLIINPNAASIPQFKTNPELSEATATDANETTASEGAGGAIATTEDASDGVSEAATEGSSEAAIKGMGGATTAEVTTTDLTSEELGDAEDSISSTSVSTSIPSLEPPPTPEILDSLVFSLAASTIEESKVVKDNSQFLSESLLIYSINNSNSEELSRISQRYGIGSASSFGILSHLRVPSERISSFNPSDLDIKVEEPYGQANEQGSGQGDGNANEIVGEPATNPNSDNSNASNVSIQTSSSNYYFKINKADLLQLYSSEGKSFIRMAGNVEVSFTLSGQNRTLSANTILFDIDNKEILANGNIAISSTSGSSQDLQNITAQNLSINLNYDKINLSDAVGSMTKSNQSVTSTYYMSGKEMTLDSKSGEVYFNKGSLSTSRDVNKANWTINSDNMIMKNNGDVLLSGIMLRMGRVPILYLPLIFMLPASPLTINPAIGFSSTKGAFINLTYELYGNYPGLSKTSSGGNSLTNLFKATGSSSLKKKGLFYEMDTEGSSSSSARVPGYMALFTDIYQNEGIFVGVDSSNTLPSNLSLDFKAGAAYKPQATPSYYSSNTYRNFRYFLDITKFSYSKNSLSLSLQLPFYSDPNFSYSYLNRLTTFSIDSIFMASPTFPATYSSSSNAENSYNFSLSYTPSIKLEQFRSLSFNMSMAYTRYWTKVSDDGYYKYASGSFTLPNATLSMSGTIFSFKKTNSSSSSISSGLDLNIPGLSDSQKREIELQLKRETKSDKYPDMPTGLESSQGTLSEFETAHEDPLKYVIVESSEYAGRVIDRVQADNMKAQTEQAEAEARKKREEELLGVSNLNLYKATANTSSSSISSSSFFTGSYATLTYSLSDSFSNTFAKPDIASGKILGDRTTSNSLSGNVTFSAGLGNNIFSVSDVLTPNYVYKFQEASNNLETEDFSLKNSLSAKLSIPLSIPNISISYSLAQILYTYKSSKTDLLGKTETKSGPLWSKEGVSSHSLSYSMSFKSYASFALSASLPPLSQVGLSPSASFNFYGVNLNFSHSLQGTGFDSLKSTRTHAGLSYSWNFFSFSVSTDYDYSKVQAGARFIRPFSISESFSMRFFNSWLSMSQSLSFYGLSSSLIENYFNSITTSISVKNYLTMSFNFQGQYGHIEMGKTQVNINVPEFNICFWKNRIVLSLGFTSSASLDFKDAFQNTLSYSFNLGFHIREFIDITISLTGTNTNFLKYTSNNRYGRFQFGEFLKDIFRGINIFSPDMANSNFKMNALSISIEHDMGDFSLSFSFTGKFELDINEYRWSPEYHILLKWGVIPELKVDKTLSN